MPAIPSRLVALLGLGCLLCAALGGVAGYRAASPSPADLADLAAARHADEPARWTTYREGHPRGFGRDEAGAALARLAMRQPLEVTAPEDPALIARLKGRLEQLKESVAKREAPAAPPAPSALTAPQQPAAPAADSRVAEPAAQLPPGRGIDVDPADAARIVRWSADGGILRSTDGGRSWSAVRTAVAGWDLDRHGMRPAKDPATLFIPAGGASPALGVVSRDGGASWSDIAPPWGGADGETVPQPAILTGDGTLIAPRRSGTAVICWTSADLGATWRQDPPQEGFRSLVPVAAGSFALFDAVDGQLAISHDGGATRALMSNSRALRAQRIAWDALAGGAVLRDPTVRGSLTVFSDRGVDLRTVMPAYPAVWDMQDRLLLRAFAADPRDPKQWFAASPALGLLRSADGGSAWKACRIDRSVAAIAIRRVDARTVLAATGATTVVLDLTAPVADLFTIDPEKVPERSP